MGHPRALYVLYDDDCGLCQRFRGWLERRPCYLPLVFVSLHAPDLDQRFPGVRRFEPERELIVVSERGELYQGPNAWVMCLWATREHRVLSHELAQPAVLPLVRKLCGLLSANRLQLSRFMGLDAKSLARRLEHHADPRFGCDSGGCYR